ncbi:MAG: VCBS repeat-containing protein [Candidatus Jordarchaeaceae archaeon]
MNRNTWKRRISLIILATIIPTLILAAASYPTPIMATYPSTYLTAINSKAETSGIMNLKIDTFLHNATNSIYNLYICELDEDNYSEALIISREQMSISGTIYYYYNLTAIKLGPTPSTEWSKSITPTETWLSINLYIFNISDFNKDNKSEIALAYSYGSNYNLSVYSSDGELLRDLTQFWQDCHYGRLVVVDWNNDGVNDILSVFWNSTSSSFNVTYVDNVTSGHCQSEQYPYSTTSCSIYQLVAGDFNSTSTGLELALSCFTNNHKILILEKGGSVRQCFEYSIQQLLYSTGDHLIFGSHFRESGYTFIFLGVYRDAVLWSFTQNVTYSTKCVVADVNLDSEPELFYSYYKEGTYTGFEYMVVDIENGQKTNRTYVPVPVSFEKEWTLLVSARSVYYSTHYVTPSTCETPTSYPLLENPRFVSSQTSDIFVVLNRNNVVVMGLFPKVEYSGEYYFMPYFEDYDGDGRLETLSVLGYSAVLLELQPVYLLAVNAVYLGVYAVFSGHRGVNNIYLFLSVFLLGLGVGLTAFYYFRRRTRALEFDRQMRVK